MRIAVLCSGGDAPGMNACIRAIVRSATFHGHTVVGICGGYQGLLDEKWFPGSHPSQDDQSQGVMGPRVVAHLIQLGGTILQSSRCENFKSRDGLQKAADILRKHQIDALIPIGGDGTFRGAIDLSKYWEGQIIGCPGTIDNDLSGTDLTIGFTTAVQTAVDAVDKLRDTAASFNRMFLVEVMGRQSGYIAMFTAIAGAAEVAFVPETPNDIPRFVDYCHTLKARGKTSVIVILAEGDEVDDIQTLQQQIAAAGCPYTSRTVTLGHLQRGGTPTVTDRILATQLGDFAVRSAQDGETGMMAGRVSGNLILTPFREVVSGNRLIPDVAFQLLETMSV